MVAAVPEIVRGLGEYGVVNVYWFLAYSGEPVIWLVTDSDDQKSVALDHGMFRSRVQGLLAAAGVREDLARRAGVTVESEETVARDFAGSWRYAMQ